MTRYTHHGHYVTPGSAPFDYARYVFTTTRADGEAILPSELERAKRASIAAARRHGLSGDLTASPIYSSVRIGSYSLRGADIVRIDTTERGI